ncbi:MAG: adenosylmethionine--8-amino-7-oxononanoate transaminase [Nitrospinota bacterium]
MAAENYGLDCAGLFVVETKRKKTPDLDTEFVEKQTGLKILGRLPYTSALSKGKIDASAFRSHVEKHIDPAELFSFIKRRESSREQKRLEKADRQNIWHPFTQMREWEQESILIVESGSGRKLKDIQGNSYYDGHSSYWVNIHGHSHPRMVRSVARQAARLEHSTFLGLSNKPAIELAEKLVEITPEKLERVFYSDNGSTAVEAALKMAFQYQMQRENKKPKKKKFAALVNAYHGDTLGAVGVGGIDFYRNIFKELLAEALFVPSPYCYRCPLDKEYPDCALACALEVESLLAKHHEEIAAFVIEPMVQCPGGVITAPHGYLKKVRELCDKYDILMIADEVAVGFGRTGRMFACEHEDIRPDLMALSKSLAGGMLPLAATLATQKIYEAFLGGYDERKTFFHGHTFTGHPLACAAALENLRMMREFKTVESVEEKSQSLRDELVRFENLPCVGEVRQTGMIVGIELVMERETKKPFDASLRTGHRVAMEARKNGLIVRPLGDVVVLFPILSSENRELKEMAGILYDAVAAVTGGFKESENL